VDRRSLLSGVAAASLLTVAGCSSAEESRATLVPQPSASGKLSWSTAWAAAPACAMTARDGGLAGYTVRNVVHTTIGGPRVRLRLTNRFGDAPVTFGHVTVALSAHRGGTGDPGDGSAADGTMREVTFGGKKTVTVAAGDEVFSDPVTLDVPAAADLLVSAWTPEFTGQVTAHAHTRQICYLSHGPDDAAAATGKDAFTEKILFWLFLAAVEVTGAPGTVVAFGDSITDGLGATTGANTRWTDLLAERLGSYGVANAGITGNRLLHDSEYPHYDVYVQAGRAGLTRFAADALELSGARTVIILIGINDLMNPPEVTDPAELTGALATLAKEARAKGLRVIGGTLTPFKGWVGWSTERNEVRQAVNAWIRAGGDGAFDAVADFDQALQDSSDPERMRSDYDSGDHLHPGDEGNRAMAAAVPVDRL